MNNSIKQSENQKDLVEYQQSLSYQEDEIDFFELWNIIWNEKVRIISFIIVSLILALMFMVFSDKIYRSSVYVLPPEFSNIEQLNIIDYTNIPLSEEKFLFKINEHQAYELFIEALNSKSMQREWFLRSDIKDYYLNNSENSIDEAFKMFEESFSFNDNREKHDKDKIYEVEFSLEFINPQKLVFFLTDYVQFVDKRVINELIYKVESIIERKILGTNKKIKALKRVTNVQLSDNIKIYTDALKAANSLGFEDSKLSGIMEPAKGGGIRELPLYYYGSKILGQEIEGHKKRLNNNIYVPDLRVLEAERDYYKSIKMNADLVKSMRVVSTPYEPTKPIKPRSILILVLSIFISGMLGVFYALFKSNIDNRKKLSKV